MSPGSRTRAKGITTGEQASTVAPQKSHFNPPSSSHRGRTRDTILVVGATGTGKSSFIATTSGQDVQVGHNLRSSTSECQSWEFDLDAKRTVRLVDTPGFNDTSRSDLDILATISNYLSLYEDSVAGLVFLHRITDKRFTGASRMTLNIVQAICGEDFFPHVVLCTSMWDTLHNEDTRQEARGREDELRNSPDFWGPLLEKGVRYMRHEGDQDSGKAVIESLLRNPAPHALGLQLELREMNYRLEDTRAGRLITAKIREKEEKLRQELLEEEQELRELRGELIPEQERARERQQPSLTRIYNVKKNRLSRSTREARLGSEASSMSGEQHNVAIPTGQPRWYPSIFEDFPRVLLPYCFNRGSTRSLQ